MFHVKHFAKYSTNSRIICGNGTFHVKHKAAPRPPKKKKADILSEIAARVRAQLAPTLSAIGVISKNRSSSTGSSGSRLRSPCGAPKINLTAHPTRPRRDSLSRLRQYYPDLARGRFENPAAQCASRSAAALPGYRQRRGIPWPRDRVGDQCANHARRVSAQARHVT